MAIIITTPTSIGAVAAAPTFSLLRLSVGQRLIGAAASCCWPVAAGPCW